MIGRLSGIADTLTCDAKEGVLRLGERLRERRSLDSEYVRRVIGTVHGMGKPCLLGFGAGITTTLDSGERDRVLELRVDEEDRDSDLLGHTCTPSWVTGGGGG